MAIEPTRLVHHLDLARVYKARDEKDRARAEYEVVIKGTITDYNDKKYQLEATEEIKDVR